MNRRTVESEHVLIPDATRRNRSELIACTTVPNTRAACLRLIRYVQANYYVISLWLALILSIGLLLVLGAVP